MSLTYVLLSIFVLSLVATIILFAPIAWDKSDEFNHKWRVADRINRNPTQSKIRKLLEDFHDASKDAEMDFWITEGTALGMYRDGDIIPWDTDVDASIYEDQLPKLHEKVIPEMLRRGCRVMRNSPFSLIRNGTHIDIDVVGSGRKCMAVGWPRPCEDHMPYIEPFNTVENNGRVYKVPGEQYLAFVYGSDWRTPRRGVHSYSVSDDDRVKNES